MNNRKTSLSIQRGTGSALSYKSGTPYMPTSGNIKTVKVSATVRATMSNQSSGRNLGLQVSSKVYPS